MHCLLQRLQRRLQRAVACSARLLRPLPSRPLVQTPPLPPPLLLAGRTYRYWRGEAPLYDFGYGLSYVEWRFSAPLLTVGAGAGAAATAAVRLQNGGSMAADTAVLLFLSYLGPDAAAGPGPRATIPGSGCSSATTRTDLVQRLVGYQRTGQVAPGGDAQLTFALHLGPGSKSSWGGFGDPEPPCGAYALRFGQDQPLAATLVLA